MNEIKTRHSEIKNNIRDRLQNMKNDYVAIGYYLRQELNDKLYLEDGYKNVHEFAQSEFGMKKATVNHCIRINMEFSVGGNSKEIDDKYSEFSKSQLQELLYIKKEKREEVTPNMTVRQIREMREDRLDVEPEEEKKSLDDQVPGQDSILNHDEYMPQETEKSWSEEIAPAQKEEKKEEPLSVLGHPKRVYPEGSMLSAKGCGSYDCFSCHRDGCEIRQEDCYCVEAPLGKPFP